MTVRQIIFAVFQCCFISAVFGKRCQLRTTAVIPAMATSGISFLQDKGHKFVTYTIYSVTLSWSMRYMQRIRQAMEKPANPNTFSNPPSTVTQHIGCPNIDFHGASLVTESGKEIPITEQMLQKTFNALIDAWEKSRRMRQAS
jgi:hypothetical protein